MCALHFKLNPNDRNRQYKNNKRKANDTTTLLAHLTSVTSVLRSSQPTSSFHMAASKARPHYPSLAPSAAEQKQTDSLDTDKQEVQALAVVSTQGTAKQEEERMTTLGKERDDCVCESTHPLLKQDRKARMVVWRKWIYKNTWTDGEIQALVLFTTPSSVCRLDDLYLAHSGSKTEYFAHCLVLHQDDSAVLATRIKIWSNPSFDAKEGTCRKAVKELQMDRGYFRPTTKIQVGTGDVTSALTTQEICKQYKAGFQVLATWDSVFDKTMTTPTLHQKLTNPAIVYRLVHAVHALLGQDKTGFWIGSLACTCVSPCQGLIVHDCKVWQAIRTMAEVYRLSVLQFRNLADFEPEPTNLCKCTLGHKSCETMLYFCFHRVAP